MKRNRVIKEIAALGTAVYMLIDLTGCGKADDHFAQGMMKAVIEENEAARTESVSESQVHENRAPTDEQLEMESEAATGSAQDSTDLTGTITMAGSTSMEKLANTLAESFMAKYPCVTVTVEFTGSSAGIESVLAGSADIGNSSRNLKAEEKSSGAVENIVAIDGIAVITDTSNKVTALSTDQLIGIYRGDIRNWSEVGGEDEPIVVIGREAGCGTRDAFEELLEIKDMCTYANEVNSAGAVMARVALTPGAIGYVSSDVLDDTVLTLFLDDIEPTEESIKAGSYLLRRPFAMVTKGEISAQSEAVQEIFKYLKSEEGQELVETVGLIVPD